MNNCSKCGQEISEVLAAHLERKKSAAHCAAVRVGIERARVAGRKWGRPRKIDDLEIRMRVEAGDSKAALAQEYKVSKSAIFQSLKRSRGKA